MKTHIKHIFKLSLVLIGLLIINTSPCQNTKIDSVKAKEFSILNLLPEQLNLSHAQKEKITLIYADHFLVKENNNGFISIWLSNQTTEKFEDKIMDVLTDSQQQILRRYLSSSSINRNIKYSIKK